MAQLGILKTTLISSIFAVNALSTPAFANDELSQKPSCDMNFLVTDSLRDHAGVVPTGEKASNKQWDMEIYANPKTGTWVLLGKSKDPKADSEELCYLAKGSSPYRQTAWYQANFKTPGGKPPTQVAQEGTGIKPRVN